MYGQWVKVEIPGTVCGNGSQYKFFVNYSETSDDIMMIFEPGGDRAFFAVYSPPSLAVMDTRLRSSGSGVPWVSAVAAAQLSRSG